jgi:hypothetical protein
MLYENSNDRVQQGMAANEILEHLRKTPFVGKYFQLKETPQSDLQPFDFTIWIHGKKHGVGEVKCRSLTKEFLSDKGWLMDKPRLTTLRIKCEDMGFPVMLVVKADDGVGYVMMVDLMKNPERLKPAPKDWMKNNHGESPMDADGIIIPGDMLTWV